MADKKIWANWHSPTVMRSAQDKGTDEEIVSMMEDAVKVIHLLEDMYGQEGSKLVTMGPLADYLALSSIAFNRGIKYPSLARYF